MRGNTQSVRREPVAAAILAAIPGTRGCCVGDLEGQVVDQHGESANAREALLASSVLAREFGVIGLRFGLGVPDLVTAKGSQAALVIAYRPECILTVDVEPSRPLKNIEEALRGFDWQSSSDWVLSNRDIEYLPEQAPRVKVEPPARAARAASPPQVAQPEPAKSSGDKHSLVAQGCAELRRTLIKGQVSAAAEVAEQLAETPSADQHPFAPHKTEVVIRPLLNAVANIVAGDTSGGLANLDVVRGMEGLGPSLDWVARVWSARANAQSANGVDAARGFAESAAQLAVALDAEAQAVSTLLLAEVALAAAEPNECIERAQKACEMFGALKDRREIGACLLLEARALLQLDRDEEAARAAERARDNSPDWPAPVIFIVKRALAAEQLEVAQRALEPLLAQVPLPSEVERARRLLEHVQSGGLPAARAAEYLQVIDEPRGPKGLRKLQDLAEEFPHISQFKETLAWKLYRAGAAKAARTIFERLAALEGLPDDLRSSVLLGLGCLVTADMQSEPPSVQLWAAVRAAPKPSGTHSAVSAATAASQVHRTDPMDLRVQKDKRKATPSPGSNTLRVAATSRGSGGPAFSGSLQSCALPELLEVLRACQKTGTLVCSSAAGIGAVHLRSGRVTGAAAPNSRDIRDYLLARKAITEGQLRVVEQLPSTDKPTFLLDLALLEQGLVSVEQVRQALRDQIVDAFKELIRWTEGKFAFDPEMEVQATPSGVEVELEPQAILLEAYGA